MSGQRGEELTRLLDFSMQRCLLRATEDHAPFAPRRYDLLTQCTQLREDFLDFWRAGREGGAVGMAQIGQTELLEYKKGLSKL